MNAVKKNLLMCTYVFWAALTVASVARAEGEMSPRDIYRSCAPAVVLVFSTDGSSQGMAGTGSIISPDGQIITNAHVVLKEGRPFRKFFVYLKPERVTGSMSKDLKLRFQATLLDYDAKLDVALLRMVDPPKDLKTLPFVDPERVEIGEPVVAIGHPETGGLWTLTSGTVSAEIEDYQGIQGKNVFQTEASINRGNSGGPLLNAYGQIVGINTIISRSAADGLAITDINFSLKSAVAVEWLKRAHQIQLAYVLPGRPEVSVKLASNTKEPENKQTPPDLDKPLESNISVLEPPKGQDVANDPNFVKSAKNVLAGKQMKPKMLTKKRPYKMDVFVEQRIKEIKELESMMDEMDEEIQARKKGTSQSSGKRSKGKIDKDNGLW